MSGIVQHCTALPSTVLQLFVATNPRSSARICPNTIAALADMVKIIQNQKSLTYFFFCLKTQNFLV